MNPNPNAGNVMNNTNPNPNAGNVTGSFGMGCSNGHLHFFDASGKRVHLVEHAHSDAVTAIAAIATGWVTGSLGGSIHLWGQIPKGDEGPTRRIDLHKAVLEGQRFAYVHGGVRAIAVSKGRVLYVGTASNQVLPSDVL